jgi:DNA-binding transcriptional ArsR family regulator
MSDYNSPTQQLAMVFSLLGQPARLQILLAIGSNHACVCHLEAMLGFRQAYISQQLMGLRKAGLVETERSGKNIFYHLRDPRWLDLIRQAAENLNVELPDYIMPEIPNCVYRCSSENLLKSSTKSFFEKD